MRARVLLGLLLVLALAAPAAAAPRLTPVGTFAQPVYLTAPPGDGSRLFVVEKAGTVKVVSGGGAAKTFLDIRGEVDPNEEEGLLSMAFAPDYATSRRFYVYFNSPVESLQPGSMIRIVEFQRSATDPDVADPATRREVIAIPHPGRSNHNGGQLQFGPGGLLYAATGDGGGANDPDDNAQNTRSLLGKLLRIDPRPGAGGEPYTVPAGNPFAGGLTGAPEVWAYGLRNPWRFSFDRETGDLALGDVGQGAREEIDFLPRGAGAGANFGWDCFEGSIDNPGAPDCTPPGHVPPVFDYDSTSFGCGVTGGYVVRDPALPTLRGRYLYGDLCRANLRSIVLAASGGTGDREEALAPPTPTVSFGEDSCGHVYVMSLSGPVNRIDDEPLTPCPVAAPPETTGPDANPGPDPDSPPGGAADTTRPKLSVGRARHQRLLRKKAVYVGVRCSEACGVTTEANVRLKVRGKTRKWAFRAVSRLAAAGERPRLRLRLTKAMKKALARRVARGARPLVKVVAIARDPAGNETRRTVYVRVVG